MIVQVLGEDHRSTDTSSYLHGDGAVSGPGTFLEQNMAYIVIFGSVILMGLLMKGTMERRR